MPIPQPLNPLSLLVASQELRRRARSVLPGGNTRSTLHVNPYPPYAVSGSGYELVDEGGQRLIDLLGNYTAAVHGNAHPTVMRAAWEAITSGTCFGLPTRAEVELAEHLVSRIPALERVRFTNSGTEAVMMAIRAARAFTGRTRVARFDGCYHGLYDPVLSADAPGAAGNGFESLALPLGASDKLLRVLDTSGHTIACVIVDVMPNRAGLRPLEAAFVRLVREETAKRGIVLIIDEVITFRIAYGGMHESYDVKPDLVVLGKAIGGGFPIGAFGGAAEIMDLFDPGRKSSIGHGGTFSANPVSMQAGLAALRLLNPRAIERINDLGDTLRRSLRARGLSVAGRGSLLKIEKRGYQSEFWWAAYQLGVLLAPNGLAAVSTPMDDGVIELAAERLLLADELCGAEWRIKDGLASTEEGGHG